MTRTTRMWRAALTMVLVSTTACGGGTVTDTPGPTSPVDTTKPPGTVQRASISARVSIDPADAAIASVAGVGVGGISVRITRNAPGFTPVTTATAADGTVRFDNLLDGVYQLSVERKLTATELQRLSPDDREASVFAGGNGVVLSPPASKSLDLPLVAARRGSLIISEIWPFQIGAATNTNYGLGTYIEVYNNSDTTIYLDGALITTTPLALHGGWPDYPCSEYNVAARMDSLYLRVSSGGNQFPGSGRDYPVPPGEGRVVAQDALDHTVASPGTDQVDLSKAQFENYGSEADTDNPFSVNMIRRTTSFGVFGRGTIYNTSNIAYVLLRAGAWEALEPTTIIGTFGTPPATGNPFDVYRIPREYVLDVAGFLTDPLTPGYGNSSGVRCSPFMSPAFERAPAPLFNVRLPVAISRKSLGRTAAGNEILQRTRTSERDFVQGPPLLRTLRK